MGKLSLFPRKNREKITIILTLLGSFCIFLSNNLQSQIDQSFKTVLAQVTQSSAVNAAQAVELSKANLVFLNLLQEGCLKCGSDCSNKCSSLIEDYNNLNTSAGEKNKAAEEIASKFDDAVGHDKEIYTKNQRKITWLNSIYFFLVIITILVNVDSLKIKNKNNQNLAER